MAGKLRSRSTATFPMRHAGSSSSSNWRPHSAALSAVEPMPRRHSGSPVRLVKPVEVPKAIRSGKANPWSAFRPPYQGWSWFYSWWAAGFGFDSTLYLDSAAGLVGNRNNLRDSDAGDFDVGLSDYNA